MADHVVDGGIGAHLAVGAQEAGGEVEADHAVAVADGAQLVGGEVARRLGERVDVGVGSDERRGRERRHVPEALFGDVREVDENALFVAGAHQSLAGIGEARAEVGRVREAEGHAVAEDVGAAPDRPNGAEPGGVEHVEEVQVCVDGFGALDVEDGGKRAARHGGADVGGAAADGDRAVRGRLEAEQQGNLVRGHAAREVHRQLGRERRVGHVTGGGEIGPLVGRGAEHGEHAASEIAGPRLGQVDMAGPAALEEARHRIGRGVLHQAEEDVVVAVEDGGRGQGLSQAIG